MTDKTRRQRLEEELRRRPSATPTDLRNMLGDHGITTTPNEVLEELDQLRLSLDEGALYVRPAECRDCEFMDWDKLMNIPSKCPECRSEWIQEPKFTIRDE